MLISVILIISFHTTASCFSFNYLIGSCVIRDLGVYLDSSLSFVNHVDYVISKSSRLIGFIKRSTSDFSNITSIIHLYNSLVLPNLTYYTCIRIASFENCAVNNTRVYITMEN